MDDDKTVMMPKGIVKQSIDSDQTIMAPTGLQVNLVDAQGQVTKSYLLIKAFTVGRLEDNDIIILHPDISRHHLEIKHENGDWWVYDLNSANGISIQERLVKHSAKLHFPTSVFFGNTGISLSLQKLGINVESMPQPAVDATVVVLPVNNSVNIPLPKPTKEALKARLLSEEEAEDSGDYTRMVRKLIREDRTVRVKKYNKVIWALGGLFVVSALLVVYQQIALSNARFLAIDMFYDIKSLEVNVAQSEQMLDGSSGLLDQALQAVANEKLKAEQDRIKAEQAKITAERERLQLEKQKLNRMKSKYQQYVKEATSFRIRFPGKQRYEEELIARVARQFGECELELPEGFVDEVKRYIKFWQASPRMHQAMERFENNHYAASVLTALEDQNLPLHFMYLPLQESNYNPQAIGPETRFGIAKGAWQFLATTGRDYGLRPGPMANVREYDEEDARFDFKQATRAGAKYLKYIYSTEAQASGLLVMAGYNYGHNRVRELIKKMPNNPRDKNFWKFIQLYQIPKETYDYVFYIFSAAVIGEDPKYFGFKFKPPLAFASAS